MIIINSNGSKWAGQEPDTIEQLIEVLNNYTLDPTFEEYGNFIKESKPHRGWNAENEHLKGFISFFGNFMTLSHVFNILTDDNEIIEKLTHVIRKNQETPEYKEYKKQIIEREAINKTLPYHKRIS